MDGNFTENSVGKIYAEYLSGKFKNEPEYVLFFDIRAPGKHPDYARKA